MSNEFLTTASQLQHDQEAYAIAIVVNREAPSSGKPGDKAIIDKNGKITGWVGGGCTRGIVLKEAAEALLDGKPRLVRISPDADAAALPGVTDYKMTCQSGGSVEIYVEPVLPRPHLLVLGKSRVAMALCRIACAMNYPVSVVARGADVAAFPGADAISEGDLTEDFIRPGTFIVVCTQGENDERALEQALRSGADYVAFVSSRKKASGVFHDLRQRGITFDQLKKVKTPAGLDIHAKLPEEVAISILAEIIAVLRSPAQETKLPGNVDSFAGNQNLYINPVCGIPVEKSTAKHMLEHEGEKFWFCCDGCKVKFEAEPGRYAGKGGVLQRAG